MKEDIFNIIKLWENKCLYFEHDLVRYYSRIYLPNKRKTLGFSSLGNLIFAYNDAFKTNVSLEEVEKLMVLL